MARLILPEEKERLTKRILELSTEDKNNEEIASELGICAATVRRYRQRAEGPEQSLFPMKRAYKKKSAPKLVDIPLQTDDEDKVSVVMLNGSARQVQDVMRSIASILGR